MRSPTPETRVLFWVGVLALVVRCLYLGEHATSAFFGVTILDERYYDTVARALAEGGGAAEINPGFRPLLYPLFLAFFYHLSEQWGFLLAVVAQHLLGVATAVLTADLAMRLFRRAGAGALAGALFVFAGPPLFFEGERLITALFTFLVVGQLWILSRLPASTTLGWLIAGAWTALAAQARPNALLFLAAYPLAAVVLRWGTPRRRFARAAVAWAGALAMLLAFAFVHQRLLGPLQLLPGAGGVNFYLGNKPGADGMIPRQDRKITYGDDYRDSVQVFAEQLYREELAAAGRPVPEAPSPAEVSRYWLGRTFAAIRGDPLRWLRLMGRKALFLAWNREIPNNKSYDFIRRHESTLLRALPVGWWLLFALAPLGVRAAWRGLGKAGDRRLLFWISAFLCLHAVGVVLFFVNSRYRVPMWPGMIVLAAGALLALAAALRRRDWGELAFSGLVAGSLAAISLVGWLAIEPESHGRDFFFRSVAHLERGDLESAAADAQRSLELTPLDAAARFQRGNVAYAVGHLRLAMRNYMIADYLAPGEPRILNNMGLVFQQRGRPDLAYQRYLAALDIAGDYPPALVNAALLELQGGLLEPAAEKIRRAEQLGFESVTLLCARAFLEHQRGHPEQAAEILELARRRDPETVARLLEEQRRRLRPGVLR